MNVFLLDEKKHQGAREGENVGRLKFITFCQKCCRQAEVRRVKFTRCTGYLVSHKVRHIEGRFCKSCMQDEYSRAQAYCLLTGWWHPMAFVKSTKALFTNYQNLSLNRDMEAAPPEIPELTAPMIRSIVPYSELIQRRLQDRVAVDFIAHEVAQKAKVPPSYILLHMRNFSTQS